MGMELGKQKIILFLPGVIALLYQWLCIINTEKLYKMLTSKDNYPEYRPDY